MAAPAQTEPTQTAAKVTVEPSARWVRAVFNGVTIADSKQTKLLVERGYRPVYYFPKKRCANGSSGANEPADELSHQGGCLVLDHTGRRPCGGKRRLELRDPDPRAGGDQGVLRLLLGCDGHLVRRSGADLRPPTRPISSSRCDGEHPTCSGRHNGETVAETSEPRLLFETHHPTRFYIPPQDVHLEFFSATDKHTRCPYKGQASYWTAKVGDVEMPDIVWSYPNPIIECPRIAGYLSFYNEQVDIYVDGEIERRPSS